MFFAVGVTGGTELESESATAMEPQPTPGEKNTGQLLQDLSASPRGTGSSAEGTQTEVKIQNMKVRMKSLQKFLSLNAENYSQTSTT